MIIVLQTILLQHEKVYSQLTSKEHVTSNGHDSFAQNFTLNDF